MDQGEAKKGLKNGERGATARLHPKSAFFLYIKPGNFILHISLSF